MRSQRLHLNLVGLCLCVAMASCEHFVPRLPPASQIEADASDVVDNTQIVVLARTSAAADALIRKANVQGYKLEQRDRLDGLGLYMLVMKIPQAVTGAAAIRQLEALEPGISAGVNHAYSLSSQAGAAGRTFANEVLRWPETGCVSRYSKIGVIDAAIDIAEPELAGTEITVRSFTSSRNEDGVTSPHGTVTALLLAGRGRLRDVRILNAAVISDHRQRDQVASVDSLVRAIDWMKSSEVQLVNISLEGPYNRILDRGFQQALLGGMVVVASVGNGGPTSAPRYPAAFPDVIGVTAVDVTQRLYIEAARGNHVDFAAPGVDVFVPQGPRGRYATGTSIAAPYVTGLIASRAFSSRSIRPLIKELEGSALDLGLPGRDSSFGAGLPRMTGQC